MGKLCKILAPIAAFLTVLLAVFCYWADCILSHQEERAAKLADELIATAQILDSGSETGLSEKLTMTRSDGSYLVGFPGASKHVKEAGSLSWSAYCKELSWKKYWLRAKGKGDHPKYEELLAETSKMAGKVVALRDAEAETLGKVVNTLGLPSSNFPVADLKNVSEEGYGPRLKQAEAYASAFRKNYDKFKNSLQKLARIVGTDGTALNKLPVSSASGSITPASPEGSLSSLENKVQEIKDQRQKFLDALRKIPGIVSKYSWKFNPSSLQNNSTLNSGLQSLASDLAGVNAKLVELERTKQELAKTKAALAQAQKELEAANARLKEYEKVLAGDDGESDGGIRQVVTSLSQVKKNLSGKVLQFNSDWHYVITDLGKYDIPEGAKVILMRADGTYVSGGTVTKVEDEISVVNLDARLGELPQDIIVILSGMQEKE